MIFKPNFVISYTHKYELIGLVMTLYTIPYDQFFSFDYNVDLKDYFEKHSNHCKQPMNELIRKYNLFQSEILSIGPKTGHEEYWFYKNDCKLTFVDIDEDTNIEPYLKKLSSNTELASLKFIIDDARNLEDYLLPKFDIVYFSSFTPNDIGNSKIILPRRTLKNRFGRKYNVQFLNKQWPKDVNPLNEITMTVLNLHLKDEGLFIYQSYASGVDARNSTYLKLIKKQLSEIGVQLLDVYGFEKFHSVHLIVGFRGTKDKTEKFLESIKNNPEITSFHGRSKGEFGIQKIKKLYSFDYSTD